jgi:hypothetical protein
MTELPSPFRPENRSRGTLLALVIIPAAVTVWCIVWSFSWFFGIIAAGIAVGALALYSLGSGGRVSFNAAFRISVITLFTLPIAWVAGFVSVVPSYFAAAVRKGVFFEALQAEMSRYDAASIVFPLLFMTISGATGLIAVFRVAWAQHREVRAASIIIDPYA